MIWTAIVLAVGIAPAAAWSVRYLREFRGDLAGYWYQVTYDPKDKKLEDPCWSIELMRVRHRGDTVEGTMWRIFPDEFYKKWSWEGRSEGAFVIGSYFASRRSKAGGSGNFFLMEIGEGRVKGDFMCIVIEDTASGGVGLAPEMWPMEWLRVDRCSGNPLAAWIETLPDRPCECRPSRGAHRDLSSFHAAIDHLPWYARRALGHAGWPHATKRTEEGLAYTAGASGPLVGLAMEQAEREAAVAATSRRRYLPHIPDLRRIDILGRAIRSPRERPHGATPEPPGGQVAAEPGPT
jgi:hypothetical protein